ncbi:MAG: GNAT family N-acetyltransferase [Chthoniobacterales bacterium]|nr:GNAT family N-acetyltransferase [Chthoniobacterales bacterium]
MQACALEFATRTRSGPIHVFALANGTAAIYARAADVSPALWAETFGEQEKDLRYYELLERTMARGFLYRYLVLFTPNDKPFALQPLILVEQDLAISLGERTKRALAEARKFLPRLMCSRMLIAGCLVGNGYFGVSKDFSDERAFEILAEALLYYAARENIPFLIVKDFPARRREEMRPLVQAGFTRLDGFPPLRLDLDFANFEEYLSGRLSKITRKSLRRKFRAAANAEPPITLEVRNNCRSVIDEIYPLYLEVARRSTIKFEVLTREYFLDASLTMPERCRFFIWRQAGKAVAFSYCTVWNGTIFDHDLGLDYAVAHELNLYYLSFRDILRWALRHGYRRYRTSPFNYDPKMHLRLELEAVDLFVRHRSHLLNFLLRHLAPRFAPAKSDPVLRRHFSSLS